MGITVFPTPTSSTSSGGSGLSTDFTKNDYGVPLPEYITCMAYKSSCTITVCPGYTFCSGSKGFSQGGLTNVKDNIFVVFLKYSFTGSHVWSTCIDGENIYTCSKRPL